MITADTRIEDPAWSQADWPEGLDLSAHINIALTALSNHFDLDGSLSILLTSDLEMRRLNATWRGKDKPTDILSFAANAHASAPDAPRFLGDLALGWGCFERDAHGLQRPIHLHLRHLLVHGLLHLLGHDHETPNQAKTMEALERTILGPIGLTAPYDEPMPSHA